MEKAQPNPRLCFFGGRGWKGYIMKVKKRLYRAKIETLVAYKKFLFATRLQRLSSL